MIRLFGNIKFLLRVVVTLALAVHHSRDVFVFLLLRDTTETKLTVNLPTTPESSPLSMAVT